MRTKRVLICGASGFLGYNIFSVLSARSDLDVWGTYYHNRYSRIKPSNPKLFRADLTKEEEVHNTFSRRWDVVIQMAANTSGAQDVVERPYIHITDNVVMNALIFQAAYDFHVPQVIFPSCTVMYPSSDRPLKETDVNLNLDFYPKYFGGAWMKVYCEKLCEFYSRLGRNKYTVLRHSNIYGPNDRFDPERSHVCGATINKVMTAENEITVWGNGQEERDFLYIDDFVSLIQMIIDRQDHDFELFNAGSGTTFRLRDWIELIIMVSGKNLDIKYDTAKPTIDTKMRIDISKVLETLGWRPTTSPEEGLKKTIAWHKDNVNPLLPH